VNARRRHEAITVAWQVPHEMPAAPFDVTRLALWHCHACVWGTWNAPERPVCRECGGARAAA
jgi:hypothetical protein